MIEHCDVLIIGTGPGGAIAGKVAADRGYSTIMLEKEAIHPSGRYKACGGAIAWEIVEEIHYPSEKIERIIETLELHHISGKTFSKKGKGAVVWRSIFDQYLADMAVDAGAGLYEKNQLLKIQRRDDSYEIIHSHGIINAKYIIAADGVNSSVLQRLKWSKFLPTQLVLTITNEIKTSSSQIDSLLGSDTLHLFFGIENFIPLGYGWLFAKKDTISVGWGNSLSRISNTIQEYNKYLATPLVQMAIESGTHERWHAHLIPVGLRMHYYKDHVFAVGDAGGFVDPISGKGIPYAMQSGKIAIEALHSAEQKSKEDQIEQIYERKLNTAFLSVLKAKAEARSRIFQDDASLLRFLSCWEKYHSSEIIAKKMI